jgi:hypothetical protein
MAILVSPPEAYQGERAPHFLEEPNKELYPAYRIMGRIP